MAGSKGRKHSKGKGKSKSKKSDVINNIPKISNPEPAQILHNNPEPAQILHNNPEPSQILHNNPEPAQILHNNPDGPNNSNNINLRPNTNFDRTSSLCQYTENELEHFLFLKLEELYTEAFECLLKSGYRLEVVKSAILNNGHVRGPVDPLNNVLSNAIAFIEDKVEPERGPFENMTELYKYMLSFLVAFAVQNFSPRRRDAMWNLLTRKWRFDPPTTVSTHQQSGHQYISNIFVDSSYESCSKSKDDGSAAEKIPSESNIDSLAKKVGSVKRINHTPAVASMLKEKIPILTAAIKQEIGDSVVDQQAVQSASSKITEASDISSPDVIRFITGSSYEASVKGFLERNPNDPKLAQIVDLVKDIRDLHEKVKERKEWAQQKVIDSAKKVSKDLIELKTLRMEKVDREQREIQKKSVESSFTLKPKEQALQNASCQLNSVNGAVRRLELENARVRADIEALKLSALESDSALKELLKREKRSLKRHADLEKQIGRLQADCYEEKQRMLQLQNELLQAKNEIEEAEMQWRQEIKEKEQMLARLAEEVKLTEIRKASSRAQLSKLRQKLEIDNQLAKDNLYRLEDEMSGLLLSQQMSSVSLGDDNFFYDSIGGITFEPNALAESLENNSPHSKCMFCSHREVSVLFLPCAHQVLCSHCFEHNSIAAGGQCPYCHVEIEQRIRVYGPSS